MKGFNMKDLNESGIKGNISEYVEFISMILLIKSKIYNKKVTELFNADDIETIVLGLMILLNEDLENIAYDFMEKTKNYFDPDKLSDLLEYYETQVKKYVTPFFEEVGEKLVEFDDIIIKTQNCQDLCSLD